MVLIWTWEYLFKKIINTTELIKKSFLQNPIKKRILEMKKIHQVL